MEKILKRRDFRSASLRNLAVCKELIKLLNNSNLTTKSHILHNIYYLGGYIIEFSIKYAFFSHLNIGEKINLYNYKDSNFQKQWQIHSYETLKLLCSKNNLIFGGDVPYLGYTLSNKKIDYLIKNWDVQIRYHLNINNSKTEIDESSIQLYIKTVEEISQKIHLKYL